MIETGALLLGSFMAIWVAGLLTTMLIALMRINALIRARVSATGEPVSSDFVSGYFLWNGVKAFLWPLTLVAWLAMGRPERKFFISPSLDDGPLLNSAKPSATNGQQ